MEETRTALHAAAAPLRAAVPQLAWVPPARLHLTLKFLGATPAHLVPPLAEALGRVARAHRDVPLHVAGAGAFPNVRRPRVVWVGVEPAARLELLQHDVEMACERLGFALEGRAFRPHVTLARVRKPLAVPDAQALARAIQRFEYEWSGAVEALELVESAQRGPEPRYRRLAAVPLADVEHPGK